MDSQVGKYYRFKFIQYKEIVIWNKFRNIWTDCDTNNYREGKTGNSAAIIIHDNNKKKDKYYNLKMMWATRTSPTKNPPATAAPETAAGDASDDDLSDPPYKPWDKASSESELDDEDDDSGKQRGTTITTKFMEKSKTDLVNIVLQQKKQIIDLQEKLDMSKII